MVAAKKLKPTMDDATVKPLRDKVRQIQGEIHAIDAEIKRLAGREQKPFNVVDSAKRILAGKSWRQPLDDEPTDIEELHLKRKVLLAARQEVAAEYQDALRAAVAAGHEATEADRREALTRVVTLLKELQDAVEDVRILRHDLRSRGLGLGYVCTVGCDPTEKIGPKRQWSNWVNRFLRDMERQGIKG